MLTHECAAPAACAEVEEGRAISQSNRPGSNSSRCEPKQALAQGARRSQRQQQQRQLKDKQLQAERLHTARISAKMSTAAVALATSSTSHCSSQIQLCAVVSDSRGSACAGGAQARFPDENVQQREAANGDSAKAAVGVAILGRKGKGSPTAGVKKQPSPVGLRLGARFPLRVRKHAEQSHIRGDLNGKFAQAVQNKGLGDLTAHMAGSQAVV